MSEKDLVRDTVQLIESQIQNSFYSRNCIFVSGDKKTNERPSIENWIRDNPEKALAVNSMINMMKRFGCEIKMDITQCRFEDGYCYEGNDLIIICDI